MKKGYRKGNEIEIVDENTIGIVIVRRNGERHVALVDKHLYYEKNLGPMTFYFSQGYAGTNILHPEGGVCTNGWPRKTLLKLHHIILPREEGKEIDHKDGNRLNNRLDNLENVTAEQNAQNRGKREGKLGRYKGVYLLRKSWKSKIYINKKNTDLGRFTCEEEAARAYDKAVVKYREVRSPERQLNFPENLEQYRQELRD